MDERLALVQVVDRQRELVPLVSPQLRRESHLPKEKREQHLVSYSRFKILHNFI